MYSGISDNNDGEETEQPEINQTSAISPVVVHVDEEEKDESEVDLETIKFQETSPKSLENDVAKGNDKEC